VKKKEPNKITKKSNKKMPPHTQGKKNKERKEKKIKTN
jgi:hypothetical protein